MDHNHRKTRVVNRGFQYRRALISVLALIVIVNLVIILAAVAPHAIGIHLKFINTSYFLVAVVEAVLVAMIWHFSIRASHAVAGPIYAFGRELCKLSDGELRIEIKLRPNDEFKDTAEVINSGIGNLRARLVRIKGLVDEMGDSPSADQLRQLRSELQYFITDDAEA